MLNKLTNFLSSFAPADSAGRPEHTLQLATAVLLIEVMRSDAESSNEEQATILKILKERFHLPDAEVARLSAMGHGAATAANDLQQFTSLINRELMPPEKVRIIEFLWQVAYADKHISAHENHLMRKIAALLFIPDNDYIAAKMRAKPADLA
ncbi:MAG: TerB family tellurite resistance protein [Gallionella sp.]